MISAFIREGTERYRIKANYVKKKKYFFFFFFFFFFLNEALTHVRLHPINTIKPRKKQSTTPLKKCKDYFVVYAAYDVAALLNAQELV